MADELHGLSDDLRKITGVSSAERQHYEADVYFWGDYDNSIRGLGTRTSDSDAEKSWRGQPVRAGLEGANRRREMDDGSEDAIAFAARRDVFRGDIQQSAREGGPSSRVRASDSTTVRGAIYFENRQRFDVSSPCGYRSPSIS